LYDEFLRSPVLLKSLADVKTFLFNDLRHELPHIK